MAIAGVHLTSIDVKKKTVGAKGKININNNIMIKDIQERDFSLGNTKQKGLKFIFGFNCKYTPDIGQINLGGDVLFIDAGEKVQEIKKAWENKKKLPAEIMEQVLNAALNKCNIEALKLSQDVNLPSPIPLPKVERKMREAVSKPSKPAK